MNEELRNWEVAFGARESLAFHSSIFAQKVGCRYGNETPIAENLTKEEALALLATMGEVTPYGRVIDNCFFVQVKK